MSVPLAQSLCELSRETGRQLGVTIDRRGRVLHVIVGNHEKLFIPDLGRARAGRSRFRGIRLVHTHLRDEPLTDDDFTDLARLRLDLIAAIGVSQEGRPATLYHTHLMPEGSDEPVAEPYVGTVHDDSLDFHGFIEELEAEFGRAVGVIETEGQVRAIAVHVAVGRGNLEPELSLKELGELAATAGVALVDSITQRRPRFDPKYVMGRGKLDQVLLRAMQLDAELLIFDQNLLPAQVRAIGEVTDMAVIDRTQLILDIFAGRAHTREGKLAVELAQLKYRLPRLAGSGTALSRLMGGIGGRGPGESKLEIDRRRCRERIHRLSRELDRCAVQRKNRRSRRQSREVPIVALVGYTNAGKSTLFNTLTKSTVLTEDKLFATLDTTTRRLRFPEDREVIFADTVGFIRDLPQDLVSAFKATLEELHEADLLLHVVDVADPQMAEQVDSVERILDDMELLHKPRLMVLNKVDLLGEAEAENVATLHDGYGVSALDRPTTRPLLSAIETQLWRAARAG